MEIARLLDKRAGRSTIGFQASKSMSEALDKFARSSDQKPAEIHRNWIYVLLLKQLLEEAKDLLREEEYPISSSMDERLTWETSKLQIYQEAIRVSAMLKLMASDIERLAVDIRNLWAEKRDVAYEALEEASSVYLAQYKHGLLTLQEAEERIVALIGFMPPDPERFFQEFQEFSVFMTLKSGITEVERRTGDEGADE